MPDRARFRNPCAILNATAGSGKAKSRWPSLQRLLSDALGPVEARFTERPLHATELAREALERGADLVIAVGGDGTLHEVVNGFLSAGQAAAPEAALAMIPTGTGSDFRRSAGLPASHGETVAAIASGTTRRIDACRIRLTDPSGKAFERFYINEAGFGLSAEVARLGKSNFFTPYNGHIAYLWATVAGLLRFRGRSVRLAFDGGALGEPVRILAVSLGNGGYIGGGMRSCPLAELDSGCIEVTVIEDLGFFEFARAVPLLYNGQAYSHPKCHHFRARRVHAVSDETVMAEVDGEVVGGGLPLEAEVLPGAILFAGSTAEA